MVETLTTRPASDSRSSGRECSTTLTAPNAEQVRVERPSEQRRAHDLVLIGRRLRQDAGVVHEHVEPSVAVTHGPRRPLDAGGIVDVEHDGVGIETVGPQLRCGLLPPARLPRSDHNRVTGVGKLSSDR